jgi:hypothetical protein
LRITSRPQEQPVTPNLRRQKRRWDEGDALPMAMGCLGCPDLGTCGGMHKKQDAYWCLDDCCGKPDTCDGMCPNNPVGFRDRMREINGLELDNIPRAAPCPAPPLPAYVPYLYHGSRRAKPIDLDTIALPLRNFHSPDGRLRFKGRADVEARFGIGPGTRIILIGSGRDKAIEAWWKLSELRGPILAGLRALGVVLVTGPNYSMFTDEVRYNDMHAMKRIGTAWQEIVAAGVPGAYHLNARTPQDYRRLVAFIAERPEVTDVAFEFKTGAAWRTRLPCRRAGSADGARRSAAERGDDRRHRGLPELAASFNRVTYIDTSAFMATMHRRRLYLNNEGKMKKAGEFTLDGQPLDGLFSENIATMHGRIESLLP